MQLVSCSPLMYMEGHFEVKKDAEYYFHYLADSGDGTIHPYHGDQPLHQAIQDYSIDMFHHYSYHHFAFRLPFTLPTNGCHNVPLMHSTMCLDKSLQHQPTLLLT